MKKKLRIKLVKNKPELPIRANSGFKITRIINRKKVEIELTCNEVYYAFIKQESIHNQTDIETTLEEMEQDNALNGFTPEAVLADKELMKVIIVEYEDNLSEGMEWSYAAKKAIKTVLAESQPESSAA